MYPDELGDCCTGRPEVNGRAGCPGPDINGLCAGPTSEGLVVQPGGPGAEPKVPGGGPFGTGGKVADGGPKGPETGAERGPGVKGVDPGGIFVGGPGP